MSKCAYCGGNNFHSVYCDAPTYPLTDKSIPQRLPTREDWVRTLEASESGMELALRAMVDGFEAVKIDPTDTIRFQAAMSFYTDKFKEVGHWRKVLADFDAEIATDIEPKQEQAK